MSALTPGARLGPYEILAPLGQGAMSACGHATPVAEQSPWRRIIEGSRWGWGP